MADEPTSNPCQLTDELPPLPGPNDDAIFELAISLGMPYDVMPESYCREIGVPVGTRSYGDVSCDELVVFARSIAAAAVARERERCYDIVDVMVRAVDGADALAAIRKGE